MSYEFEKYDNAVIAKGWLESKYGDTRKDMNVNFKDKEKLEHDHRGHLIAERFNPPSTPLNLYGQDKDINLRGFKRVENAEAYALKQGKTIETERIAFFGQEDNPDVDRPDAFLIKDRVVHLDGSVSDAYFSFSNISYEEQNEMDKIVSEMECENDEWDSMQFLKDELSEEEYNEVIKDIETYGDITPREELLKSHTVHYSELEENSEMNVDMDQGDE